MLPRHNTLPSLRVDRTPFRERVHLLLPLAIYAGAMGAASLLVNLLSRTKFPQTPEHMEPSSTAFLSFGAFVVCGLLGGLLAYWHSGRDSPTVSLVKWLAFGFAFGVLSPPLTGAFLPMSTAFLNVYKDVITVGELPSHVIGALFRAPSFAFTHGVFGLFTGLLAGALFGAGAWLAEMSGRSPNRAVATFAPYAVALSLSALIYGIATLGPAETLARLG